MSKGRGECKEKWECLSCHIQHSRDKYTALHEAPSGYVCNDSQICTCGILQVERTLVQVKSRELCNTTTCLLLLLLLGAWTPWLRGCDTPGHLACDVTSTSATETHHQESPSFNPVLFFSLSNAYTIMWKAQATQTRLCSVCQILPPRAIFLALSLQSFLIKFTISLRMTRLRVSYRVSYISKRRKKEPAYHYSLGPRLCILDHLCFPIWSPYSLTAETGICKQNWSKEGKGEEKLWGWCLWAGAPQLPREAAGGKSRGKRLPVGKERTCLDYRQKSGRIFF